MAACSLRQLRNNTLSRLLTKIMITTLSGIHVYPVKALGGIALPEAQITPRGLRHDRRFLVIDRDGDFITQREQPKMATVWMEIDRGELVFSAPDVDSIAVPVEPPEQPARMVAIWSSHVPAHPVSAEADAWLSAYLECDAQLVYMPDSSERRINPDHAPNGELVSFADGYPLLIASEASLADLNQRIVANNGRAIPMNRFRPNLVITGCEAYAEDRLGEVRIGDAVFRAVKRCTRCQVTTTDQASGVVVGPEPLQTLATYRDTPNGVIFGMNLIPVNQAVLRIGDAVTLAA